MSLRQEMELIQMEDGVLNQEKIEREPRKPKIMLRIYRKRKTILHFFMRKITLFDVIFDIK